MFAFQSGEETSSSRSSLEFVQLDAGAVAYHHKERTPSKELDDEATTPVAPPRGSREGTPDSDISPSGKLEIQTLTNEHSSWLGI